MEAYIADLQRKVANMVRSGVVHAVQVSPLRARVKIGEREDGTPVLTGWLRVSMVAAGPVSEAWVPSEGAAVQVLSEGGDLRLGVVYPGLHTDALPSPATTNTEHVTLYPDGGRIVYDWGASRISISLPGGNVELEGGEEGWRVKGKVVFEDEVECEKTLDAQGDIRSASNLADSWGTFATMRAVYNGHTHNETDSVTQAPNQPMKSQDKSVSRKRKKMRKNRR